MDVVKFPYQGESNSQKTRFRTLVQSEQKEPPHCSIASSNVSQQISKAKILQRNYNQNIIVDLV